MEVPFSNRSRDGHRGNAENELNGPQVGEQVEDKACFREGEVGEESPLLNGSEQSGFRVHPHMKSYVERILPGLGERKG